MYKLFKLFLALSIIGSAFGAESANLNISAQMIETLEKIIDKNKTENLILLLNNNTFNVNGTGLKFGIKEIKEGSYSRGGDRINGCWSARYSVAVRNDLTPLIFAAIYAKPQIINILFQAGANPNKGIEIEGKIHFPLTIAYSGNFHDREEKEALVEITQEFVKKNISPHQIEQALNFVDKWVELYDPELAQRLRELLEAKQRQKNQIMASPEYQYNDNQPPSYEEAIQE